MAQKILGINTCFEELEYPGFSEVNFNSRTALFGYDAIIIDASYLAHLYSYDSQYPTYQNKRLLSNSASFDILEDYKIIKEQFVDILKAGKNIYVLLGTNDNCYIYTGETKYDGTGKNARRTNMVNIFDTYSFLPIDVSITHALCENIEFCCNPPYKDFFNKAKEAFKCEAYFNKSIGTSLINAKGSNRVISAVVEFEAGKIIFLPQPYYEDEYREEKYWKEYGKKYLEGIFELNERLCKSNDDFVLPEWANQFSILNEKDEKETLEEYIEQQKILEEKVANQESKIRDLLKYKTLITSSGVELENIVKQVLSELGFSLSETEPGRSDVIGKYGKKDVVVEIKGVSKSAAEKHAAQLEKWVALFIEENEKTPKPLLIVNGFCDLPIAQRTEDVFPKQMLKYCITRGHALISTMQLLCLFIEIKNNPGCKKERIKELLATEGVYKRYTNFDEYLIPETK